ncbi:MAG: KH domain-containing protein [Nanoarchaeota archaeon]
MATIDLQTMRYINLLDRISGVKTSRCFNYNNTITFAVPKNFVSKAIGLNASNIREMQENFGKKVRIVEEAQSLKDAERFIRSIVAPVSFKSLEIKDNCLIINAGAQSKAALIGRNKRRLEELRRISIDNLGVDDLKIF